MSNELEQEIVSKGLTTGPRTTNQEVEELLTTVHYDVHHIPGTVTVVVTAILPIGEKQWTLATAYSSAASNANFNLELGTDRALEKAKAAAKEELWKLESYVLAKSVASKPRVDLEEEYSNVRDLDLTLYVSSCGEAEVKGLAT